MTDDLLADLLAAVEQQLVSPETPYVAATLTRLVAGGLEADEAKIQIADCLGEEMDEVLTSRKPFDQARYRAALDALPHPPEPGNTFADLLA